MPDRIVLESRIERVELYHASALVTRRVEFSPAEAGCQSLTLGALPLGLLDASVRLRIEEVDAARVLNLHLGWQLGSRDGALKTPRQAKLNELARKRIELKLEQSREWEAVRFFESLGIELPPADELPDDLAFAPRHPLQAWLDLASLARREIAEARARVRDLGKKLRELADTLAQAKHELDRESRAEIEALSVCRKEAHVELEVVEPGPLGLRLSYLVPAARWAPEYELRVAANRDEAELLIKALVAQRSGEDWDGVKLAFSTADLERSTELPELDSWRIGKAQPAKASGWRPLPEGLEDLFAGYDRGRRALPSPPQMVLPSLAEMPRLAGTEEVPAALASALPAPAERLARALKDRSRPIKAAPPPPPAAHTIEEDYEESTLYLEEECEEEYEEEYEKSDLIMDECEPVEEMMISSSRAPEPKKRGRRVKMKKERARPAPRRAMAKNKFMPPPAPSSAAISGGMARQMVPQMGSFMEGGRGGGGSGGEAEVDAGVTASAGALGFADLRMRGADASRARGQLEAVGSAERLREHLDEELKALPDGLLAALAPSAQASVHMDLPRYGVWPADSAGHFVVRYSQEGQGVVAADGQMHQLALLRRTAPVRRVFRCVPIEDEQVYQVVELINPLKLALLAGPVRVFRGGDFVVTAPLETTAPGKRLSVNLGVEPGIRVARNLKFHESTEGLFKGGAVLEHTVEIEVRNNLSQTALVEIFERVPVSDDDDVKVEEIRSEPKAQPYDQADRGQLIRGGWRFSLELKAGERRKCRLEYRIEIPSKHMLEGGNRRD